MRQQRDFLQLKQIEHPLIDQLDEVQEFVCQKQDEIREKLHDVLIQCVGVQFTSFPEKQEIARRINALLVASKTRLKCRKKGCTLPATLKVVVPAVGTTPTGVFQFQHGNKSTHAIGPALPKLEFQILTKDGGGV